MRTHGSPVYLSVGIESLDLPRDEIAGTSFFERPILNSPYQRPARHWDLDSEGRPTDNILETRRPSALWTALPGASTKSDRAQTRMVFDDDGLSTDATEFNPSPIVNDLRQELDVWRRLPNPSQWKVSR